MRPNHKDQKEEKKGELHGQSSKSPWYDWNGSGAVHAFCLMCVCVCVWSLSAFDMNFIQREAAAEWDTIFEWLWFYLSAGISHWNWCLLFDLMLLVTSCFTSSVWSSHLHSTFFLFLVFVLWPHWCRQHCMTPVRSYLSTKSKWLGWTSSTESVYLLFVVEQHWINLEFALKYLCTVCVMTFCKLCTLYLYIVIFLFILFF